MTMDAMLCIQRLVKNVVDEVLDVSHFHDVAQVCIVVFDGERHERVFVCGDLSGFGMDTQSIAFGFHEPVAHLRW